MPVIFDDEIAPPKGIVWDDETPASAALKQTRATLPLIPGDEVPPPEDQAILDQEERERQRRQLINLQNQDAASEIAGQEEFFNKPIISPEAARIPVSMAAAGIPGLAAAKVLSPEITGGLEESAAGQISGMTSPKSLSILPAFLIPIVGEALAGGMAYQGVREAWKEYQAAKTPKEKAKAFGDMVGAASMFIPAIHGGVKRFKGAEPTTIGEPNALYSESQKILPNVREPEVTPESEGALHVAKPGEETGARGEPSPNAQAGEKIVTSGFLEEGKPANVEALPTEQPARVSEQEVKKIETEPDVSVKQADKNLRKLGGLYRATDSGTEYAELGQGLYTTDKPVFAYGFGADVERIEISKDANIIKENGPAHESLLKTAGNDPTKVRDIALARGIDGIKGTDPDTGTVIFNESVITRRQPVSELAPSEHKALNEGFGRKTEAPPTAQPTPEPGAKPAAPERPGARGPYQGAFLDNSFAQEKEGFPKAKEVLKGWSNEQLERERAAETKASLDRMFGHNAKKVLNLINAEIEARKPTAAEAKPVGGEAATAKEPFQMTRSEYRGKEAAGFESLATMPEGKDIVGMPTKKAGEHKKWQQAQIKMASETRAGKNETVDMMHRRFVQQAIERGKPVPPEVLADYPDLAPATTPKGAIESQTVAQQLGDVESFVSSMTPMQKGKAKAALDKSVQNRGKPTSISGLVENRVSNGAKIETVTVVDETARRKLQTEYDRTKGTYPFGNQNHPETIRFNKIKAELESGGPKIQTRRLVNPDESFLSEKQIGKIAMDYADHLIKQNELKPVELSQSERDFGISLSKKYGSPVSPETPAAEPYETLSRFSNMLERAADKSKDASELEAILSSANGKPFESRIAWAVANNPHSSLETFSKAKDNPALMAMSSDETFARLDSRRAETRKEHGLAPEPTAQRAQPEETPPEIGQGPGAKTKAESAKPEQPESLEFTGLKHAIDELERVDYGFDKRPQQERQAMAEAWVRAGQTLLDNPLAGKELADKLILNPKRGLTGDESALLLRHKRNLQESLNNAAEATITGTPEARAEARIIFDNAEAELNQFMDAVAVRGSEWGREGRWRQAIAYEDYTFATQERLLRAAKNGERLTDAEHERLVKDVAEHKALLEAQQRRMAEQEQRHAKAIEDATKEAIDRIIARQPKIHPDILAAAEKIVVGFENRAKAASIRLREKLNRLGAAPDPTILVDLAEIGAGKLARKALDFAEWSKSMLDEFGEKITPYLQDAFDASKRLLSTDLVKVKGPKAEQIKRGADAATQEANTTAKIRNKVSEGKLGDISFEVHKLAKMFVERGIRNRDALIDAVHAVLKDIIPDITRRDTMDAISGYGRFERLSKDEISVQLRDLKGQMQQVAKLEDMAAREAPRKTGIERRSPSDEERRLIALVNEAKKKGGYEVTDPETQLVSAQMTRMTYLRNRIADLQHEIATKERIVKERREPPTNPEIESLKAEYKSLREERNKLFNTALDSFKKRASKRIAELEAKSADLESKLKEGTLTAADIAPKPKRVPLDISKDTVAMGLKAKLAEVENRIGKARYDARMALRTVPRRIWDGIKQTASAFVNIKSSFDFSAPRQALVALLSLSTRPIAGWPKIAESFGRMFSAAFSEKRAYLIEQQIKNRPNAVSGLDKLAKIDYTSLDATNFTKYEDAAHSVFDEWAQLPLDTRNTAKTIATFVPKVFARGVRGSNRAFITFLNSIRASLADELFKFGFKDRPPTEVEAKDIGNLVNLATGRGNLNPMTAKVGASVLWSPNLLASRLKLLSAQPFWNPGSARTKALVASEYARVIGAGYLLWQVAQMFDTKKEKKWTSADHGKIVRGNTRIDLWGGFQQVTTLAARVAAGETTSEKGRTQDITKGKFGVPDLVYIGARFARSKLRPDIGLAVDILNRSDFIGRSTNIKTPEGRKNLKSEMVPIPLALDDVVSILKQHGFTEGMAIEALSQFGVGVSQHEAISRQR